MTKRAIPIVQGAIERESNGSLINSAIMTDPTV
jgi:hypothetical protein